MKRILFHFFLIFELSLPLVFWGQAPVLKLGPRIKLPIRYSAPTLLRADTTGTLWVRKRVLETFGRKYTAERYSGKFKQLAKTNLEMEFNGKKMDLLDAMAFGDRSLLFSTLPATDSAALQLQCIELEPQSLTENPPFQLGKTASRGKLKTGTFSIHPSPNTQRLLIYSGLPKDREAEEKFTLQVIDTSLSCQWRQTYQLPFSDKLFEIDRFKLDNEGNAYLSGILYRGKVQEQRKGAPNYEYLLFQFGKGTATPREIHVDLKDKFITDLNFVVSPSGDLVCAGFYSDEGTISVKGTFFFIVDGKTGAIRSKSTREFEPAFLAQFMPEKRAKKKRELYDYNLRDILLHPDGGATLVAEQFYEKVVTRMAPSPSGGTPTTLTYFHYNDIIVVRYGANAEVEWMQKIPKQQTTIDDEGFYSSYLMAQRNETLFFLFNDHPDNTLKTDFRDWKAFTGEKAQLKWIKMDEKGELEAFPLLLSEDKEVMVRPGVCRQLSENEVLIYGEYKRKFRLGKLLF